ncbi:hypothetical protein BH09BAC3_BH09BAC3_01020 [soil metagenome]
MNNEEELQSQIEKSATTGNGLDSRSYQVIFNALKKEPSFKLSNSFEDKVIQRIEEKKEAAKDAAWIWIGVASFIIAAVASITLTGFKFNNFNFNVGAFRFLAGYPGLFIFGTLFVLGLQLLDKKIIRPSIGE